MSHTGATRSRRGLSLIEVLVALAISAMIMTAVMLALDASLRAYSDSVRDAEAQSATRVVMHRVLRMARNSTGHAPLSANEAERTIVISGDTIESPYLAMIDEFGQINEIHYLPDTDELELRVNPHLSPAGPTYTLMTGVEQANFRLTRRRPDGWGEVWLTGDVAQYVLSDLTIELTVRALEDTTLGIERHTANINTHTNRAVRMVGSVSPRREN